MSPLAVIRLRSALLLVILPSLLACGAQSTGPAVYPVAGIVTEDGKPISGAVVQFHPAGADYGPLPGGVVAIGGQATTAEDGRYSIESTFDQGKTTVHGLPAGAYVVTIRKMEVATSPEALMRAPKNVLDTRYAAVESTPVKVTVSADSQRTFDIPL
jgi:hypothetical protein